MNCHEVLAIAAEISLGPGRTTLVNFDPCDLWIQIVDPDNIEANGRKWRISQYATKSEVVQTIFKAYLTWLEHEARETFTYKG